MDSADPHSTGLYAAVGAGDGGSFGTDPAGRKLYDAGSRRGGLRAGCAAVTGKMPGDLHADPGGPVFSRKNAGV